MKTEISRDRESIAPEYIALRLVGERPTRAGVKWGIASPSGCESRRALVSVVDEAGDALGDPTQERMTLPPDFVVHVTAASPSRVSRSRAALPSLFQIRESVVEDGEREPHDEPGEETVPEADHAPEERHLVADEELPQKGQMRADTFPPLRISQLVATKSPRPTSTPNATAVIMAFRRRTRVRSVSWENLRAP